MIEANMIMLKCIIFQYLTLPKTSIEFPQIIGIEQKCLSELRVLVSTSKHWTLLFNVLKEILRLSKASTLQSIESYLSSLDDNVLKDLYYIQVLYKTKDKHR